MAQAFPRFCPQCGSPREAGQRFCPHCGTSLDTAANNPTAKAFDQQSTLASPSALDESPFGPAALAADGSAAGASNTGPTIPQAPLPGSSPTPALDRPAPTSSPAPGGQLFVPDTGADSIAPPPPPPDSLSTEPAPASPYSTPPTPGTYTAPSYARAPKRSRAGLFAFALLLVLVLGGVGGYVVFFRGSNQRGTGTISQQGTTGNGRTTSSNTPVTGGPTTEPLNLQFTYASEEITLTLIQEAASFADDLQPHQGQGLVRINMNETNPTRYHAGFGLFSDVAHLLLPDGSTVSVNMVKSDGGLDANASRINNWIDFAISNTTLDLSQLVLRLGTPTDHQMDIPLKPGADLSAFQPRTITPNTPISYGGLNWTLLSATLSLSANGVQATADMRYLTLSLRVDNPTTQDVGIGFPTDYLRLKSAEVTSAPITGTTTLPLKISAGTTGVTGTVLFLMPESDTAFTLEWLAHENPVYDPVSSSQVNTLIAFP